MQFYFVKQDIELVLKHKRKPLRAVPTEFLEKKQAPLDRVYCGNIAWECIAAKRLIGESGVYILQEAEVPAALETKRLEAYTSGRSIKEQLQALRPAAAQGPWRLALVNGTGTMLGDTIVGASVVEHVVNHLRDQGISVTVDVYLAWNARPDVPKIWNKVSGIKTVFESSPTVSELLSYDGFWDYSRLLAMPGFESLHRADFYFGHFGIDPAKVHNRYKLPLVRVNRKPFEQTQLVFKERRKSRPIVWVDPYASTPARSMPTGFFLKLLKQLASGGNLALATAAPLPKSTPEALRRIIIDLSTWTQGDLDRYISALALADVVVCVDTLGLHLAMGCAKPGVALFAVSSPDQLLKYSPQISGRLIPNAMELPYWGRHKGDERWGEWEQAYEEAWNRLNLSDIVKAVERDAFKVASLRLDSSTGSQN